MTKLGRGLSALIPEKREEEVILEKEKEMTVSSFDNKLGKTVALNDEIDISLIRINPEQPRKYFDEEKLKELSQSIKQNGIIQPLIVIKNSEGGYDLIAGERRLRAAKSLGFLKVPVFIRKNRGEQTDFEAALIENIQREDLSPVEEAKAYLKLKELFGMTQEKIAERVGKSRSVIANKLRILSLPEKVLEGLQEGQITFSHARSLLRLKNEDEIIKKYSKIINDGSPVHEVEEELLPKQKKKKNDDPEINFIKDKLEEIFSTKVKIQDKKDKGKIVITYFSREELRKIIDKIMSSE